MSLQLKAGKAASPSIKTPQELVHIRHKISLRQYKTWILALRAYREDYERGIKPDDSGFHRIAVSQYAEFIGYEPVRAELRTDLEAIRKEPIIYNFLGKDGKTAQRGAGFISEWEVSTNWIGVKLPGFLTDCIERLDLKNAMFQALNWSVFNSFSGKYEAIIYKLCKDYVGVQRTPYMTIAAYREYMGLEPNEYSEFKDLNKFLITGPVNRINRSEISDITVVVGYKKEGRRVVGLQFEVTLRQQAVFGFAEESAFAQAKVVIAPTQQQKYLAEKSPEQIALSIERANAYAEEQERAGKNVNLGAIYQKAITQDWGVEHASKQERENAQQAKRKTSVAAASNPAKVKEEEGAITVERSKVLAKFESLPPADRTHLLERFAETLKGPLKKAYLAQGLASPMIRGSLAGWLARNA